MKIFIIFLSLVLVFFAIADSMDKPSNFPIHTSAPYTPPSCVGSYGMSGHYQNAGCQ